MTLLALTTIAIPAAQSADKPVIRIGKAAAFDSRCGDAYRAVRWYRAKYDTHRRVLQQSLAPPVEQAMNCRRLRERARYWIGAAKVNRLAAARRERYTHLPNPNDWVTAVRVVQRVYPGTEGWLLSCSSAEGGHGAWVWYGGRSWQGYHIGYDSTGDTVGGWLQFRYSTFAPYWRHAQTDVRQRGFSAPELGGGRYDAWLAPLGQALTGGYMRFHGKDGYHWSASYGRGCS